MFNGDTNFNKPIEKRNVAGIIRGLSFRSSNRHLAYVSITRLRPNALIDFVINFARMFLFKDQAVYDMSFFSNFNFNPLKHKHDSRTLSLSVNVFPKPDSG